MKNLWPEEIYRRVNIGDLILISFYNLENSRKKIDFELILKECFRLFPNKFNLSKYPQWPDARKLDRPLRSLRDRKLISGNPKEFFSLTNAGKKTALGAMDFLRQKKLKLG